jgi:hypothetical protein
MTQHDDTQQTILITIVKIKCMRTLIAMTLNIKIFCKTKLSIKKFSITTVSERVKYVAFHTTLKIFFPLHLQISPDAQCRSADRRCADCRGALRRVPMATGSPPLGLFSMQRRLHQTFTERISREN